MEISLYRHCHHLSGESLIRVLNFLARFTEKAIIQAISVRQAFVTFLWFLVEFAICQYDAMVGVTLSKMVRITLSFEAVQYVLTSYAQAKDITKAVLNPRDAMQKSDEDKKQLSR